MSLYPSFQAGAESTLAERVRDVEEQLLGVSESLTKSFSQLKDAILSQGQEFRRLLLEQDTKFTRLLDEKMAERDRHLRSLEHENSRQRDKIAQLSTFQKGVYDSVSYRPDQFGAVSAHMEIPTIPKSAQGAASKFSKSSPSGAAAPSSSSPSSGTAGRKAQGERERSADEGAGEEEQEKDPELTPSTGRSPAEEVNALWKKYKAPLESIFLYYAYVMDFTKSKATIGRAEFTKLVRDTLSFEKLSKSGINHPDLIFMRVWQISQQAANTLSRSRSPAGGLESSSGPSSSSGKMVYQGQEFGRGEFQTALVLLSESVYGHRVDLTQAQRLELFMLNDLFPHAKSQPFATEELPELEDEDVRNLFKRNTKFLRKIFDFFTARFKESREHVGVRMTFKSFSEVLKYYEFLGQVPRHELREIYRLSARSSFENGMSFGEFVEALGLLGNKVYSSSTFDNQFPTVLSRVQKLIKKLTLFADPRETDFRGN